jgi:hypothetical protein
MRKTFITTIALACAAALAGCLAMTAARASAGRPEEAKASDTETFRFVNTVVGSEKVSTLATGTFTDGGYTVPGKLNATTLRAIDKVVFPTGSLDVTEHVTSQYLPLPTAQCLVHETIKGSYTLSGGTGSVKGIRGSGTFVTYMNGVLSSSKGECGGAMIVYQEISTASGPASIPVASGAVPR